MAARQIYFGLVHQKIHNVDALHYKIGAAPPQGERGPDLGPHPPTPRRGWGLHLLKKLWPSVGGCDQKKLQQSYEPDACLDKC
jgi:hypothetical protein